MEAYPLSWPASKPRTPISQRKRAQFSSKNKSSSSSYRYTNQLTVAQAVKRVTSELDKYTRVGQTIRVPQESIVISTNIPVRKDGLPRSDARKPEDSGAAVYFTLDKRQYCLPCDKWDRVEDNIAAVAAHISALRGIERWGVGETTDAYAGYAQLPESTVSEKEVFGTLGLSAKPASIEMVKSAYRSLAMIYHPDRPTGNRQKFEELNIAYQRALKFYG